MKTYAVTDLHALDNAHFVEEIRYRRFDTQFACDLAFHKAQIAAICEAAA